MLKQFLLPVLTLTICLAGSWGCNVTSPSKNIRDTVFIPYMISTMPDPLTIVWSGDWAAAHHLWTTLVGLKADGTPVPRLASSWNFSEDRKKWTFNLVPNRKWSDGSVITTEQVVASLNISLKGTSHTDLSGSIISISGKNDTVVFELKRPVPALLVTLSYIDWAILHPDTVDIGSQKPKLKSTSPVSGQFTLTNVKKASGPVEQLEFIRNKFSVDPITLNINHGFLSYFPDCEWLAMNQDRALAFRSFAENMTEHCRSSLEKEFNIMKLQPTWVIGAQFTASGEKHFSSLERQALLVLLHKDIEKTKPSFGVQRATGLLPPYMFGALSEEEFAVFLTALERSIQKTNFSNLKGKTIRLVTMELWEKWGSFKWLKDALTRIGIHVEAKALPRSEYFNAMGTDAIEQRFDFNFIPTGVGDPDPDGTWQTASKNFFPGSIDLAHVSAAFFETDHTKRAALYKNMAREFLSKASFLPFKFDSPYVGVHKSLKLGDVAPFRAGLTLYDLAPANQ